MDLAERLQNIADESDFSGVITVSRNDQRLAELTRTLADRAHRRPNDINTQFGMASVTKGLTALAIVSLISAGKLGFDTTLRSLLDDELALVDPAVTIEHLLGHTSGVGDYLDEDEPGGDEDYVKDMPVHLLNSPRDYLPLMDSLPQKSEPGDRWKYNNSGFVMLSIAVEVASGKSFYDVVQERVLDPAGMTDTAFFRGDALPARAAVGYLTDGRTNIFHLPVRGAGDGGVYSTVADMEKLWSALFGGRILPTELVELLTQPRNDAPSEKLRYGLGFWLRPDHATVMLEGQDPGISTRSAYDIDSTLSYTVLSNTTSGAWPICAFLDEQLPSLAS